jgi:hypothetical protein
MKSSGVQNLRPFKKLIRKALDAHSRHRDRHRPTGCSFALSDRVDYFDPQRWDELTAGHSVFLSRRYLRVLEVAGPPNVRQRYAMIFHGNQPLAAVAAQAITASADRVPKATPNKPIGKTLAHLEEQILVCDAISRAAAPAGGRP